MNKSCHESVIFAKPRTNKESRDIIQRLHDIGKTEFYNYYNAEQILLCKNIKPFYSVFLLADVVPLNKLFGKDYIFYIDKRKEEVLIMPTFVFPPPFKIRTYKEFMEMDTFELMGSFKEMDLINREADKLIKSGVDLPINCCERFDLVKQNNKGGITPYKLEDFADFNIDHGVKYSIPRESIIPPNKIIICRTKEECKWFIKEMEKVSNDNFYTFVSAHDRISRITIGYLNYILEDPVIASVIFYFSYDTNPFRVYYYKHDEMEMYEIGSIIEASDLMKQEEKNK